MRTHTVLVGMSPADAGRSDDLHTVAEELQARLAFLQLGDPGLPRVLSDLADEGAPRVVLVGFSSARSAPGLSWLRRVADHWSRSHAAATPTVAAPAIAAARQVLRSAAEARARWQDAVSTAMPLRGTSAPLTSAAWEEVPGHRHQVFVCRGPRCTAAGAEATADALTLAAMRHGLGDDDVLFTQTGCQFPCNQAPVVSVQPDDVWYGCVSPQVADRVVAEHLVAGVPAAEHRLPRTIRER